MFKKIENTLLGKCSLVAVLLIAYLLTNSSFLLAFTIMVAVVFLGEQWIKSHSSVFYCTGGIFAIITFLCMKTPIGNVLPFWVSTRILPMFYNGAFATAVFVLVMYVGAVSGTYSISKTLRRLRGELSIFGSIIILGHNLTMIGPWISQFPTYMEQQQYLKIAAGIFSLVMVMIMIPLFVTSFPRIRRKMTAKKWKKLQRSAYLFYALIYMHILVVYLPLLEYKVLDFSLYTLIFGSYFILRIHKYLGTKQEGYRQKRIYISISLCVLVVAFYLALTVSALSKDTVSTLYPEDQEEFTTPSETEEPTVSIQPEQTETPNDQELPEWETPTPTNQVATTKPTTTPEVTTTPAITSKPSESVTESPKATIKPTTKPTSSPTATTSTKPTSAPTVTSTNSPTTTPTQAPISTPKPTPTVTPSKYKDGTYTGQGSGFSGTVEVSVVIKNDQITSVSVNSHNDTPTLFDRAKALIEKILNKQSTDVDVISGATFSSKGIISAVNDALKKALN